MMSFYSLYILFVNEILLYRAEFTKYVVTPAIGISGVGSSMAAYGAFDGIVSTGMQSYISLHWWFFKITFHCSSNMLTSICFLFPLLLFIYLFVF